MPDRIPKEHQSSIPTIHRGIAHSLIALIEDESTNGISKVYQNAIQHWLGNPKKKRDINKALSSLKTLASLASPLGAILPQKMKNHPAKVLLPILIANKTEISKGDASIEETVITLLISEVIFFKRDVDIDSQSIPKETCVTFHALARLSQRKKFTHFNDHSYQNDLTAVIQWAGVLHLILVSLVDKREDKFVGEPFLIPTEGGAFFGRYRSVLTPQTEEPRSVLDIRTFLSEDELTADYLRAYQELTAIKQRYPDDLFLQALADNHQYQPCDECGPLLHDIRSVLKSYYLGNSRGDGVSKALEEQVLYA